MGFTSISLKYSDQRIRKLEGKSSDLDTEDGYLYDDLEDLDDAEDFEEE